LIFHPCLCPDRQSADTLTLVSRPFRPPPVVLRGCANHTEKSHCVKPPRVVVRVGFHPSCTDKIRRIGGHLSKGASELRVAFQGEPGAFSEAAAVQLLGEAITTVPRPTFDAVFRAIADG